MNRRLFPFLIIAGALLLIYNKEVLFLFQIRFLKQHQEKSTSHPKKYAIAVNKPFFSHRPFSKVWAHRVDRLERYLFLQKYFEGFEVDIVFDSIGGYFDVGHPPSASIGLSFEKYLQSAGSNDKFFWLDLKNLDNRNVQPIIDYLNKLDITYRIKERVIIESPEAEPLSKISGKGYFTSYYYTDSRYSLLLAQDKNDTSRHFLDQIDAVSHDGENNDLLKTRFPAKPVLIWALSIRNYLSHDRFSGFDRDTSTLVYLVNIKSPYYR